MIRDVIREFSGGVSEPRIEVVDQGLPSLSEPTLSIGLEWMFRERWGPSGLRGLLA